MLAQSSAPEARATLEKVARGSGTPELQVKAVQYIAMSGQPEKVTMLNDVYASAVDHEVKRQVLRAFAMAGDRQRVVTAAQTEKTPELRTEAVHQLGVLGAREELWQLYQKESAVDVKRSILSSLARTGAVPRLTEVVASERNAELRAVAVRQLGMAGGSPTADTLVSLYAKESDVQVRRAIIDALGVPGQRRGAGLARAQGDQPGAAARAGAAAVVHAVAGGRRVPHRDPEQVATGRFALVAPDPATIAR